MIKLISVVVTCLQRYTDLDLVLVIRDGDWMPCSPASMAQTSILREMRFSLLQMEQVFLMSLQISMTDGRKRILARTFSIQDLRMVRIETETTYKTAPGGSEMPSSQD